MNKATQIIPMTAKGKRAANDVWSRVAKKGATTYAGSGGVERSCRFLSKIPPPYPTTL
jgi:hypothetical protein